MLQFETEELYEVILSQLQLTDVFEGSDISVPNVTDSISDVMEPMKVTKVQDQIEPTVVRTIGGNLKSITLTKDKKMLVNCEESKSKKTKGLLNVANERKQINLTNDKRILVTVQRTSEENTVRKVESPRALNNIETSSSTKISKELAEYKVCDDKLDDKEKDCKRADSKEVIDLDLLNYSPMSSEILRHDIDFIDEELHHKGNNCNSIEEVEVNMPAVVEYLKGDCTRDDDGVILDKAIVNTEHCSVENGKCSVFINGIRRTNDEIITTTEKCINAINESNLEVATRSDNSTNKENYTNNTRESYQSTLFEVKERLTEEKGNSTLFDNFEDVSMDKMEEDLLSYSFPVTEDIEKTVSELMETEDGGLKIDIEPTNRIKRNGEVRSAENIFIQCVNIDICQPTDISVNLKNIEMFNKSENDNSDIESKQSTKENEVEQPGTEISNENQYKVESHENVWLPKISEKTPRCIKYDSTLNTNEVPVNMTEASSSIHKNPTPNPAINNNVDVKELEDNFLATCKMQEFNFDYDVIDLVNYLREINEINQQNQIRDEVSHMNIFDVVNLGSDELTDDNENMSMKHIFSSEKNTCSFFTNAGANATNVISNLLMKENENTPITGESVSNTKVNCRYSDNDMEKNRDYSKEDLIKGKEAKNMNSNIESQINQTVYAIDMFNTVDLIGNLESNLLDSKDIKDSYPGENAKNLFSEDSEIHGKVSNNASNSETLITTDESLHKNIDEILLEVEKILRLNIDFQKQMSNEYDIEKNYLKENGGSVDVDNEQSINSFDAPKPLNYKNVFLHSDTKKNASSIDVEQEDIVMKNPKDKRPYSIVIDRLKKSEKEKFASSTNKLEHEAMTTNNIEKIIGDTIKLNDMDIGNNVIRGIMNNAKHYGDKMNSFQEKKENDAEELEKIELNNADNYSQTKSKVANVDSRKRDSEENNVVDNSRNKIEVIINRDKSESYEAFTEDFLKELNETFNLMKKYV
ncbi:hypothetical protein EVAR_14149_1 [Eumeta japonica]|uniref:Uncharacterized protein n=1 Tax=Eumeta variegata TaxID=151549 RepID=A0A4C1UFT1_EUMVA|nr:hypothetical protein EVAR_14149_1 [Eumeta japonica]